MVSSLVLDSREAEEVEEEEFRLGKGFGISQGVAKGVKGGEVSQGILG